MRLLAVAVAAVALLPATAHAAEVKVTWPDPRTYAPGEELTVKVSAKDRTPVVLVRKSQSGKVLRVIARRSLRTGSVSARVGNPGEYEWRVGTKTQKYVVGDICAPAIVGDRAEIRLLATTVRPGGLLPYQVVNTSVTGCLGVGEGYALERLLPDGTWTVINPLQPFPLPLNIVGRKPYAKRAFIPADATPGIHRLRDSVTTGVMGKRPGTEIELVAQFEVTP